MLTRKTVVLLTLLLAVPGISAAQVDARMFRQPAVSQTQIAFVYAGDIWIVSRKGGTATRLSSPQGEESFPRFSPDGTKIAYSAAYDGNTDVYVVNANGGEALRLTYHPMADRVIGWHPDGKRVLFASSRESGRQRFSQFFLVGLDGGVPEKLPVPYGEFGAIAQNGTDFVYMPMSLDFRTWKRYRGGWTPDLWLFNLKTYTSRNLTNDPANDAQPMWHGNTIYFVSDRGPTERNNIWALDVASGKTRQITQFNDFDLTFPSAGADAIVFQAGGRLYLLDCDSEKATEVPIRVVTDETTLRPRTAKAEALISDASISPTGKRAVFGARGDVVSVPAEHGAVVNITRSSGVAERYPRWSPDGKTVAYWSDRSGEYELTLRPADGSGAEEKVTSLGPGFRYTAYWSADSKKLAFIDQAMKIRIYDVAVKKVIEVDQSPDWISHGGLEPFRFQWSPDSRWLAYARPASTSNNAIFLYNTKAGKLHQATSGYLNDAQPVFDPEGKYLFYASDQSFEPVYGNFDNSWTYPNPTQLVAVPLRRDVKSPLDTRNDAEGQPSEPKADEEGGRKEGRKEGREERRDREASGPGERRHRYRWLRSPQRCPAAQAGQLRRPAGHQGQAALPPAAADRLQRREESDCLLRLHGARGEDGPRRGGWLRGDVRRQETVRGSEEEVPPWSRSSRPRSSRSRWRPPTSRCRSSRARSGGKSSPTRTGSSATSFTTPACMASIGQDFAPATASCSRTR